MDEKAVESACRPGLWPGGPPHRGGLQLL